VLRRPTAKTASVGLNVSAKSPFPLPGSMPGDVPSDFLRRSGSRESIHRKFRLCVRRHLVSGSTLCPLGQPQKAIGHESLIGPWLPIEQPPRLSVFRSPGRRHDHRHENARNRNPESRCCCARSKTISQERDHCLRLGAECTKASAAASGRRKMSLNIPSYRTSGWQTIHPASTKIFGARDSS
jgi:hypothetical protein